MSVPILYKQKHRLEERLHGLVAPYTFFHMSDFCYLPVSAAKTGVKLGQFPRTVHNTPAGIYGYPLNDEYIDKLMGNGLPFRGEAPAVYVFRFKPEYQNKILLIDDDYDESALKRDVDELRRILIEDDFLQTDNDVKAFDSKTQNAFCNARPVNLTAAKWWNLLRIVATDVREKHPAKNNHLAASTWTKLMIRCGYVGAADYGKGLIYSSEPAQAVAFLRHTVELLLTDVNPWKWETEHKSKARLSHHLSQVPWKKLRPDLQQLALQHPLVAQAAHRTTALRLLRSIILFPPASYGPNLWSIHFLRLRDDSTAMRSIGKMLVKAVESETRQGGNVSARLRKMVHAYSLHRHNNCYASTYRLYKATGQFPVNMPIYFLSRLTRQEWFKMANSTLFLSNPQFIVETVLRNKLTVAYVPVMLYAIEDTLSPLRTLHKLFLAMSSGDRAAVRSYIRKRKSESSSWHQRDAVVAVLHHRKVGYVDNRSDAVSYDLLCGIRQGRIKLVSLTPGRFRWLSSSSNSNFNIPLDTKAWSERTPETDEALNMYLIQIPAFTGIHKASLLWALREADRRGLQLPSATAAFLLTFCVNTDRRWLNALLDNGRAGKLPFFLTRRYTVTDMRSVIADYLSLGLKRRVAKDLLTLDAQLKTLDPDFRFECMNFPLD